MELDQYNKHMAWSKTKEGIEFAKAGYIATSFGILSAGESMSLQVPIPTPQALTSLLIASRKFDIFYGIKQLGKKYGDHAPDFGVHSTKKNPRTLAEFKFALEGHMANEGTSEYGKYILMKGSTVHYNPVSERVVVLTERKEFLTGFQLYPGTKQYEHFLNKGVLR